MANDFKLDMARTHEACPVCNKEMGGELLIGKRFVKEKTPIHDALHNKVTGVSRTLCDDCKAQIGDNVFMVEFDKEKTKPEDLKEGNPWRTGKIAGVTRAAFERWFGPDELPKNNWAYVPAPIVSDIIEQGAKQS